MADAIADAVDVAMIGQGRGGIGPLRTLASAANMGYSSLLGRGAGAPAQRLSMLEGT